LLRERLKRILKDTVIESYVEGLESIIRELILKYRPLSIIIAGSLAKDEFVMGLSDIDVVVITKEDPGKNRFMLRAIENTDVEITFLSIDEVFQAIHTGNQFVIDAIISGKEVYGDIKNEILKYINELH